MVKYQISTNCSDLKGFLPCLVYIVEEFSVTKCSNSFLSYSIPFPVAARPFGATIPTSLARNWPTFVLVTRTRTYSYNVSVIDTWQIVVMIAGVDRISLSTGMKLMAREWYGHAKHRRNFTIVLCDENPSEHVPTLPVYSWHHIPTVSSHLHVSYAADTSLCQVRLCCHVYSIMQNYSNDMANTMES